MTGRPRSMPAIPSLTIDRPPAHRCDSPISTANPNPVKVEIPRRHPYCFTHRPLQTVRRHCPDRDFRSVAAASRQQHCLSFDYNADRSDVLQGRRTSVFPLQLPAMCTLCRRRGFDITVIRHCRSRSTYPVKLLDIVSALGRQSYSLGQRDNGRALIPPHLRSTTRGCQCGWPEKHRIRRPHANFATRYKTIRLLRGWGWCRSSPRTARRSRRRSRLA